MYRYLTAIEFEVMDMIHFYGKSYGLEIMKSVNKLRLRYNFPLHQYGSFYPVLHRLKKLGLIEHTLKTQHRDVNYFILTEQGRKTYEANSAYRTALMSSKLHTLQ